MARSTFAGVAEDLANTRDRGEAHKRFGDKHGTLKDATLFNPTDRRAGMNMIANKR